MFGTEGFHPFASKSVSFGGSTFIKETIEKGIAQIPDDVKDIARSYMQIGESRASFEIEGEQHKNRFDTSQPSKLTLTTAKFKHGASYYPTFRTSAWILKKAFYKWQVKFSRTVRVITITGGAAR